MADLSLFDVNKAGNPNNGIFGLPFTEEESKVVILPVPWEVTVSYGAGTSRAAENILKASLQVDIFYRDAPDAWKKGIYMRPIEKKILLKSDYLRKEAELYIDFTSKGEELKENKFMCKSLRDINEGSLFLNNWVYEQTLALLNQDKLVVLLGGDHSTPLGYWKAIAEKHGDFGILQIDAHTDLRPSYEGFKYSHASVAYNALNEIPALKKLVQIGVRDYSQCEAEYIKANTDRLTVFFDRDIKDHIYEGGTWASVCDEVIKQLPQKVYISYDIDGLDPKLTRNTGTPVPGGFESAQLNYLFRKILKSGRQLLGFDLVEAGVGVGESRWDSDVAARELWSLCNMLAASN